MEQTEKRRGRCNSVYKGGVKYPHEKYSLPVSPNAGGRTTFVISSGNNFYVPGITKPKKVLSDSNANKKLSPKEKQIVFCVVNKTETMDPKEAIFIPKVEGLKAIKVLVAYAISSKAIQDLEVEEEKLIKGTIIDDSIVLDNYFINAPVYGQVEKKQDYLGIKNPIKLILKKENMLDN